MFATVTLIVQHIKAVESSKFKLEQKNQYTERTFANYFLKSGTFFVFNRLIGVKNKKARYRAERGIHMNKKRIFACFAAVAVLSASTVTSLAEYDPSRTEPVTGIATKAIASGAILNLNGVDYEIPAPYTTENGTLMIPLRATAEAMGFDVQWHGDTGDITLENGALYVKMNAFADGYSFSKMAAVKLGTAPIAENGMTFVPAEFITEVMGGDYRTTENGIKMVWGEMKDVAVIDSVDSDEKQLTVTDTIKGEVVLNIDDNTYITDQEGNEIAFADLTEGLTLRVTYSDMMTRSIPPQNAPQVIVVLDGSPAVVLPDDVIVEDAKTAVIGEVNAEENTVTVTDSELGEVILAIGNTEIFDADGKETDVNALQNGMTVRVEYGDIMTMSLPPVNNPKTIKIIGFTDIQTLPTENLPVAE